MVYLKNYLTTIYKSRLVKKWVDLFAILLRQRGMESISKSVLSILCQGLRLSTIKSTNSLKSSACLRQTKDGQGILCLLRRHCLMKARWKSGLII